ncbi:MAG: hypothetical protein ACREEE_06225 [Dongiaceae bacterium]
MRTLHAWSMALFLVVLGTPSSPGWADTPAAVTVKFEAIIVKGAKPLTDNIAWTVEPAGKDGTPTQQASTASPEFSLIPGKYRVTAVLDHSKVMKDIVVAAGGGKQVIDLNSGHARLSMFPNTGAKPITEDISWEIFRYSKGEIDESRKVASFVMAAPTLTLPAGYYTVRARYQSTVTEMVMPITAGILYKYIVNLYAGKVSLTAIASNGKAVKDKVSWKILRATKSKSGERETLVTDTTAAPTIMLREGKYVVVVESAGQVGETPFEITAGKTKKVKVELKPAPAVAGSS